MSSGTGGIDRFCEFSLLGMLASGWFAVAGSGVIAPLALVLSGAALLARILHTAGVFRIDVPGRWVTGATIAYLLFYPLDYLFLSREFIGATVHLVFFLAIAKVLTASSNRDFFFLKIIAFLELLAASILSTNLSFFLFLIAFLVFTVATFSAWEIRTAGRGHQIVRGGMPGVSRRLTVLTAFSTAGILLLTAGLFFVLPRTARAALERLLPMQQRVAGFANEVTLGQPGSIFRDTNTVLRIRFGGDERPSGLHWRGNALAEFDGIKWFNSTANLSDPQKTRDGLLTIASDNQLRRRDGPRLNYAVIQNALAGDALFTTGVPEYLRVSANLVFRTPGSGFRIPTLDPEGMRYQVYSFLEPPSPAPAGVVERLPAYDRNYLLRLPPVDPRIGELARRLAVGHSTDYDRARAIERYLRNEFTYSLEPLREPPEDPLANFLFVRRKGHCEYFASAMAVLLRYVWIPSRVATGFLGGNYNPLTGYLVVRGADAHSWVEAWIPDRGWVTFDPTPPDLAPQSGGLWSRFNLYADAAETFWQNWILGYDLERQVDLAFRVDRQRRVWNFRNTFAWVEQLRRAGNVAVKNGPWLLSLIGAATLLLLVGPSLFRRVQARLGRLRMQRGQARPSDASLLYQNLLRLLERRGFRKPAGMTPLDFSHTLPAPAAARAVRDFTLAYNELRFGGRIENAPRLAALLLEIEQLPFTT